MTNADLDGPFGRHHLPYGSVRHPDGGRAAVARVGDLALDLGAVTAGTADVGLFAEGSLDAFLASGPTAWARVRDRLQDRLSGPDPLPALAASLTPLADVTSCLPFTVADYVDFYASEHHATNVGRMFRPGSDPLTPNWRHLPIGYHGRAGTITVSGTPVRRPSGQYKASDGTIGFGPSQRLDLEAELAFVIGAGSDPGKPVTTGDFTDHVFGVALLNDWSARDIQSWEYVPLGPFLGKSFATSLSGWITPLAALDGLWCPPPPRHPPLLPYLDDAAVPAGLDLTLEVEINGSVLSRPRFAQMYWTVAQLVAHTTVNGAHLRTGDVLASGTVSSAVPDEFGSLLEMAWSGERPVPLADGTVRSFLLDGDEVVLQARGRSAHGPIELGEVRGRIVAADLRPE